jgi:hypothetical protein
VSEANEDMPRSDRERTEGFPPVVSVTDSTASERTEGFPPVVSVTDSTASERTEGFQRLLPSAITPIASERAEGFQRTV